MKCEAKAKQKAAEKAKKETKGQQSKDEDDQKLPNNWAKYELPPSDEDEDVSATGADFQLVLESSSTKSHYLQLKSEKQWTAADASAKEFTSEFFALNLNNLETTLETVPFYQILDIPKTDLDVTILIAFCSSFHNLST